MQLKFNIRLIFLLFFIGWTLSCEALNNDMPDVVATVGNRKISQKEFTFAYEFAPRSKTQLGKRTAFNKTINKIIDKILLAEEGRSRGYDNDTAIDRITDFYRRAAIVRELYLKHVRDPVIISEEEMRLAYKKLKTTLYVKNYVFEDINEVKNISSDVVDISHIPIFTGVKTIRYKTFGLVDIIHWNDLNKNIEEILFQLQVNQLSEPYFDGKRYHIFQIVDKEYDIFLTENDFYSKRLSLQKVIRRRKEHDIAFNYMKKIMKPQNLIIKANSLDKLTDLFWNLRKRSEIMIQSPTIREISGISDNANILYEPIALFHAGDWTIEDFLFNYELKPIDIRYNSTMSVKSGLKNAIAILVRDYVLSEQGIKEGLENNTAVIDEVQHWEDKLFSNKVKRNLFSDLVGSLPDTTELEKYYDNMLSEFLQDLRNKSHIEVDTSALYAVITSDEGLPRKIDFVSTLIE